jgi:hypothetical protein
MFKKSIAFLAIVSGLAIWAGIGGGYENVRHPHRPPESNPPVPPATY